MPNPARSKLAEDIAGHKQALPQAQQLSEGDDMADPLLAPTVTGDTHSPLAGGNGHHDGGPQWPELVSELDGLERRLATQPVIEQAKGILMGHFGIASDVAFDVLRRWSSHTNLKVRGLSQVIITAVAAESPADPRRPNRELINLINRLDEGQIPSPARDY